VLAIVIIVNLIYIYCILYTVGLIRTICFNKYIFAVIFNLFYICYANYITISTGYLNIFNSLLIAKSYSNMTSDCIVPILSLLLIINDDV